MGLIENLMERAEAVARKRNISLSRLGYLIADDGKFFDRLQSGKSCTVKTYESAMRKLSDLDPESVA